jgi:hypothetical protein
MAAVVTRCHSQYVPNEASEIDDAKWSGNHEQGFVADRKGPEVRVDREESNASDNERNLSKHHLRDSRNRPRNQSGTPDAEKGQDDRRVNHWSRPKLQKARALSASIRQTYE